MKNISKLFILFAAVSFMAASCAKTQEYEPAPVPSGNQVYFPLDVKGTAYDLTQYPDCSFEIPVYRVETANTISVSLQATADAAFTIPSTVTFEAGMDASSIEISWDIEAITPGQEYPVVITILDETSVYGESKLTITCSKPNAWNKLYTGHVYEDCRAEDYGTTLYCMETDYENILYCKLVDAWNDISGDEPVPTADYYFYWDTKTNNLFVPHQTIGMSSSSGYEIYVGDAPGFYNAYYGWGKILPSEDYFEWAPKWTAGYGFFQPYYDGNGGFYLADWMYLCSGGTPTGSGYQFGGNPDYFIADGFVRIVDYNDDDHIGASAPAYTGNVSSMFFSENGTDPYAFESGLRYDEVEDEEQETTTYYLTDYFKEGYCLAFTAPVELETGSAVSDVANEQPTGLYAFGNSIYVTVAGGSVTLKENETAYPIITIKLKVYCKDDAGNVTYDFGTMVETFSGNGILKDNYTMDDLYGGYYEDYLGTWHMTATFESQSGFAEKSYDVKFLEDVAGESYKIANLSSYGSAFRDTVKASYWSSYGILEVHPQALDAKYQGYDVLLGLSDIDSGYFYDAEQVTIYGGICTDGNFAFVNAYSGYNICGFYYYVEVSGQYAGLCGLYYAHGSSDAASSASARFAMPERKDYVTIDEEPQTRSIVSMKATKVSNSLAAPKTFSHSPVTRSSKAAKAEIQFAPAAVNF